MGRLFGRTWESGDPVHIGTAVGGFQAYVHVVGIQIDRFVWEAPVAIAEFESLPGAVPRQVLGLVGFFEVRVLLYSSLWHLSKPGCAALRLVPGCSGGGIRRTPRAVGQA